MKNFIVILQILCLSVMTHASIIQVPGQESTIATAIQAASDGDTVLVARGTYTQSGLLNINKSVTLASNFIFSKDDSDIDNTIIRAESDEMAEWIELSAINSRIVGFKLLGSKFHTLNMTTTYAEVMYCKFINGKDQLSMSHGGGYVGYCYFEGGGDDGIDCDDSVNWIIEHNTIVNAHQDGIEIRLQDKGAPLTRHIFRYNKIIGSGESGIQIIDYQDNSYREFYVHHNIFLNCRGAGFSCMYQEKDNTTEVYKGSLMMENAYVYNNTFDGCNYGLTLSPGLTVINNLFANSKTRGIERGDYVNDSNDLSIVDYCLFYNNPDHYDPDIRLGANIITDQDPLLDDNQNLLSGSPCIDAGTAHFEKGQLVLDIPASEYSGRSPDLGAKEFGTDNWSTIKLPMIYTGADQVIIEPVNQLDLQAFLSGKSLSTDNSFSLQWSKVSGPGDVTFSNATGQVSTATFSEQGTYELMLTGVFGKTKVSDKLNVSFVKDYVDKTVNAGAGKEVFIEAEDYRYLMGAADVKSVPGASGKVVQTLNGHNRMTGTEYQISTQSAGTYYVWVSTSGNSAQHNELFVAFNDLDNEIKISSARKGDFSKKSWQMAAFPGTPEGIYPLRIRAEKAGVMWDRIFITTDANQHPW